MNDLTMRQMMDMQYALWEKHRANWSPMEPKYARNTLLWMMGEVGEVIDLIKKCGEERIMSETGVKASFTEEMCDILMYFTDVLLRYGITPEEMAAAYAAKHERNMSRDYELEAQQLTKSLSS